MQSLSLPLRRSYTCSATYHWDTRNDKNPQSRLRRVARLLSFFVPLFSFSSVAFNKFQLRVDLRASALLLTLQGRSSRLPQLLLSGGRKAARSKQTRLAFASLSFLPFPLFPTSNEIGQSELKYFVVFLPLVHSSSQVLTKEELSIAVS